MRKKKLRNHICLELEDWVNRKLCAVTTVTDKQNYMMLFFVNPTGKLFLNYRSFNYERCSEKYPSVNWLRYSVLLCLLLCLRCREGDWGKLGKEGQVLNPHEEGEDQTLSELLQGTRDNGHHCERMRASVAISPWHPGPLWHFQNWQLWTRRRHGQGCSKTSVSHVSIESPPSGCISKDIDGGNWRRKGCENGRCWLAEKLVHGHRRGILWRLLLLFWGGRIFFEGLCEQEDARTLRCWW